MQDTLFESLIEIGPDRALEVARAFSPEHAATARHVARLDEPDQWTLQIRALLPAHLISLGDTDGAYLYVSAESAEPVLLTTRRTRAWGYASAVVHWIYSTPIRRNGAAWSNIVIWTSIAGSVLVLTGLAWGVWQLARSRGTPYTGLMGWHHYTGLAFGVVTFTFVFSGLLSMPAALGPRGHRLEPRWPVRERQLGARRVAARSTAHRQGIVNP